LTRCLRADSARTIGLPFLSHEDHERHGRQAQCRLSVVELARQRPEGTTITECPIETEIGEKVAAYLSAGAREVWVVGDDGVPEIHTTSGRVAASGLGFELLRLDDRGG
jgi:hypothetical protein